MKKNKIKQFMHDYETVHSNEIIEWWYALGFLKSVNDNKKWCFKVSLKENRKLDGMIYVTTLFDQNEDRLYHFEKFISYKKVKKDNPINNGFRLSIYDSYIYGNYPDYNVRFKELKNKIEADLKYNAKVKPFWIAQNITSGWLPAGLSFFRYGYIPKCDIAGKLKINEKIYEVNGQGYMEHVYGNLIYGKPVAGLSELKKTISIYAKLITWWMQNQVVRFPKSIAFTTENSPMGYDWSWAVFSNGWSIFYGNFLSWMMEGPATGILYLTMDEKTRIRFSNISHRYIQTKYAKEFDCVYPTEYEITASEGKKKMFLHFKMTSESHGGIIKFPNNKYWQGYILLEAPGIVEGYYSDGDKKIELKGIAKIEPQRQVSIFGHNSLKLNFLLPPKGLGITFDIDSHFLRKKLKGNIQLIPHLKLKFNS